MPGRIARGGRATTTTSALPAKSSAQGGRGSARNSSPSVSEMPDEGADSSLRRAICAIFSEAQKSTTGHKKNSVSLRKLQEACCYEPVSLKKAARPGEDFEEDDFNREMVRCVLRVLPVKKAEPVGDRVVRFLGRFLHDASVKDNEIADHADPDATSLPETPTSRLTTQILLELLPKLSAKDKNIRFRATQITSHIVNSLDTLDDSLFHQLRFTLLKRIHDKESIVRLQAVYGLGRLAAEVDIEEKNSPSDSDSDTDNIGTGVLEKLLNVLQNDPAAEVRRNLLLNLPLTKDVLPYLLERARDADASTRRALYARLLPALGDFRHLSLTHREKLLRWGLRDRDESVRKATARLFSERWIEDCAALPAAQAADGEQGDDEQNQKAAGQTAAEPSLDALLELLERVDVVNSGIEGGIALTAMHEFWSARPDYLDYVSFPDDFWDDLNPELAFVARTFNDFCRSGGNGRENPAADDAAGPRDLTALVEEKLPEVTKFGFFLEREMNKLIEGMRDAAGEDEDEDEAAQREFVVEQLLHMALTFDYADEVGRRKMFGLMREALALPDLPEEATRLVVEVLRSVCGEDGKGERQFCGVVLEAIAEVHDTIMGDDATEVEESSDGVEESFHSATEFFDGDDANVANPTKPKSKKPKAGEADDQDALAAEEEKAIREIMVNMKCLHIALCMLQNVGGSLEDDPNLVTMLNNLVVPAVRSQEAPIRERGLLCLGLCCLLGKNLAQENLTLFLHCFAKGHSALQVIALQIIADILVTHPSLLALEQKPNGDETSPATAEQTTEPKDLQKQLHKAFSRALKSDDPSVQSTGATALAKAMLPRLITDKTLLIQLVVAFFDPDTSGNAHLRQSLSYFLPVYCHSRAENAKLMAECAPLILSKLAVIREGLVLEAEMEDELGGAGAGDAMVKLTVVALMLVDWTDPRKIVGFADATAGSSSAASASTAAAAAAAAAGETHFLLAQAILERLTGNSRASPIEKEEKKALFSMLGKLHLPADACGTELLKSILTRVAEALDSRLAPDATCRNQLTKLNSLLLGHMNALATAERGGGGPEETVLETTEVGLETEANLGDDFDEDDDEGEDVTALQKTMRDTTLGATTIGPPDAEGTRVVLGIEDSEMMDVDGEEYRTEISG